jgi:hypothetical protein
MEPQVRTLWMEDGREAEERTVVAPVAKATGEVNSCDEQTVKELYVEKKPPKHLAKRITEKKMPIVYERLVEEINPDTGEITERQQYKLDTDEPMILKTPFFVWLMPSKKRLQ